MKNFIKEKAIDLVGNSDTPTQVAMRAMLIEFSNSVLEEIKNKLNNCGHGHGYTGCNCKNALGLDAEE